jgi:hypothetical protein
MRIFILFLTLFIGTNFTSFSQTTWGIEGRAKAGFLMGHRVVMGHLAREHSFAGELSFVYRANGEKSWHKHYKYPEITGTLFFGGVGNKEVLGNYLGIYSSLAIPFVNTSKFRLNGKLGAGLSFSNKVYDEQKNPKNVAVSTYMNALINLGLDAKVYFDKNWVTFGVDLTHFSNGGFKVPNLGLNLPYLSVGYGRFIQQATEHSTVEKETTIPQRKLLIGATGIFSAKEVFPTNGKPYPVFALNLHARMFMKPRVGWEVAFDAISKQSIFGYREEVEKTQWKIMQFGVYAGYLLPLNNFHFVLGMGVYLRDFYNPDGRLYHRVGMRYYLKNGVHFNVVLKSHWGKADYVEWGVGYTFFKLKRDKK